MPRITFTRDTTPNEGGPHMAGETIECSEASAQRWFRRGAAEPARDTTPNEDNKAESAAEPEAKSIDAPPEDKSVKSPPKKK